MRMHMGKLISHHKRFLTAVGMIMCQPKSFGSGDRDNAGATLDKGKIKGALFELLIGTGIGVLAYLLVRRAIGSLWSRADAGLQFKHFQPFWFIG